MATVVGKKRTSTTVTGKGNGSTTQVKGKPSQPPTVSSITPNSGSIAGGLSVTITGTNFSGAASVKIGGVNVASFTVVSGTSIAAVSPALSAGVKSVTVTTSSGSGTGTNLFTAVDSGGGVPAGQWAPLKVGAGGFSTSVHCSDDGLSILTRIDVFGAYIWNAATSSWDCLNTPTRMAGTATSGGGCYEIRSAPSSSAVMYMLWAGSMWKTTDRGTTWSVLSGWTFGGGGDPNDQTFRTTNYHIAIDPFTANHVIAGVHGGAAYRSINGGTSWAAISGITTPSGPYAIEFDGSGGTDVNGRCKNIYISPYGQALYKSTNAGTSFSSIASSPSNVFRIRVDASGRVYALTGSSTVNVYSGSAWSTISTGLSDGAGANCSEVAIDYNNAGTICCISAYGNISFSTNSGSTWVYQNKSPGTLANGDVPWIAQANLLQLGSAMFSKSEGYKLYLSCGTGIYTTTIPTTNVAFNYTVASNGIESLNTNGICSPSFSTNHPIGFAWDFSIHYSDDPATNGQYYGPGNPTPWAQIVPCWDMDYSKTGSTVVGLLVGSVNSTATSTDGGQTWKPPPANTDLSTSTLATDANASNGDRVLSFSSASAPGWIDGAKSIFRIRVTGTNVPADCYITSLGFGGGHMTVNLSAAITGSISSGSNITFALCGTACDVVLQTTASTSTSSNVLTFAGGVPAEIVPGRTLVTSLSNSGAIAAYTGVISRTDTTVTLGGVAANGAVSGVNVSATVSSGDFIRFNLGAIGGSIATSSPSNWVVAPSDDWQIPRYTTDGGATWAACDTPTPRPCNGNTSNSSPVITGITIDATKYFYVGMPFINTSGSWLGVIQSIDSASQVTLTGNWAGAAGSGVVLFTEKSFAWAYYTHSRLVAADEVTSGTFYLINQARGISYKSTDGGATWTSAPIGITVSGQGRLMGVPGNAGHVWYSSFSAQSGVGSSAATVKTTNGGSSWSAVTGNGGNVVLAYVGFGKVAAGQSYPSIVGNGKVNGVGQTMDGTFWRSIDGGTNWTNLGQVSNLDTPSGVTADKNSYRVYASMSGSGYQYIDLS